jgi:carbon storage regulator
MLVLTRKVGEKIFIGNDITIHIALIERGKVRIGIDAPETVPIHRSELHERIAAGDGPPPPDQAGAGGLAASISPRKPALRSPLPHALRSAAWPSVKRTE